MIENKKVEEIQVENKIKLIIDTNAFIKCLDINKLATKYDLYTSDMVLYEIRDKKARDKFSKLMTDIKTKIPSKSSLKNVTNFSKKTGDFPTLSETDLEIIAIAYTLIEEKNFTNLLRSNPPEPTTYIPPSKEINKSDVIQEEKEDSIPLESTDKNEEETIENRGGALENQKKEEEESDDDKGWINHENISQHFFQAQKIDDEENKLGVAVMTSDFAMQNVIIQMGIPLLSLDGMTIKKTKKWVLECSGCKRLCKIMDKEFCPTCGNHTLTRISCSVNADGTFYLFRKKNYQYNTRGLIFSIPKPLGGRKNNDLLLREDEFIMRKKNHFKKSKDKEKEKAFQKAQINYDNGFGFDVIQEKKFEKKMEYAYGRKNPNEPKRAKK